MLQHKCWPHNNQSIWSYISYWSDYNKTTKVMITYCDMLHVCGVFRADDLFVSLSSLGNNLWAQSVLFWMSHDNHALKREIYPRGNLLLCLFCRVTAWSYICHNYFYSGGWGGSKGTDGVEVGARGQTGRPRHASLNDLTANIAWALWNRNSTGELINFTFQRKVILPSSKHQDNSRIIF